MHICTVWAGKVRRKKAKLGQSCTDKQRQNQLAVTYISCARSVAKTYPTIFGSWPRQTWTRGGWEEGWGQGAVRRKCLVENECG